MTGLRPRWPTLTRLEWRVWVGLVAVTPFALAMGVWGLTDAASQHWWQLALVGFNLFMAGVCAAMAFQTWQKGRGVAWFMTITPELEKKLHDDVNAIAERVLAQPLPPELLRQSGFVEVKPGSGLFARAVGRPLPTQEELQRIAREGGLLDDETKH